MQNRRLATPEELASFRAQQKQLAKSIKNIHQPLVDALGLFVMPEFLAIGHQWLRSYEISPIDMAARWYCDAQFIEDKQEIINANEISNLLSKSTPFNQWPNYLIPAKQQLIKAIVNLHDYCKKNNIVALNAKEIKGEMAYYYELCTQNIELRRVIDKALSLAVQRPEEINNMATQLKEYIDVHTFNLTNNLKVAQRCLDISVSFPIFILSILSARITADLLFKIEPFGLFYQHRKYKPLFDKHDQINAAELNKFNQTLIELNKEFSAKELKMIKWLQNAQIGILLLTFTLYFAGGFSGEIALLSFVETYLMSYSAKIIYSWIKSSLEKRQLNKQIAANKKLLNEELSKKLNLPEWISSENTSAQEQEFFLLKLSHKTYKIDGLMVPKKILLNNLIQALEANGIQIELYNTTQIILPASIAISVNQITKAITDTKSMIKDAVKQQQNRTEFEEQIQTINNAIYNTQETFYYRLNNSTLKMQGYDYSFVFRKDESVKAKQLMSALEALYGKERIEYTEHKENAVLLKISYGSPAAKDIFDGHMNSIRQLRFPIMDEDAFAEADISADTARRQEQIATSAAVLGPPIDTQDIKTPLKIIKFGRLGTYKSNVASRIKPISAAFWPDNSNHYMIFTAPRIAFKDDVQYEKFRDMLPHIVRGKKGKGLVPAGTLRFFKSKKHHNIIRLKMKDPVEEIRVYDDITTARDTDGNTVYLHNFNTVMEKTHSRSR